MDIRFKEAAKTEEKETIYRLRYRICIEELNLNPDHVDYKNKMIKEPIDDQVHNFYVRIGDEIAGAVRVRGLKEAPFVNESDYDFKKFDRYYPDQMCFLDKFLIASKQPGEVVARELLFRSYEYMRSQNYLFSFVDCWPHLINLYERLGFRKCMANINHNQEGYMTPMVLVLEDVDHFKNVQSPLVELASKFQNGTEARDFFQQHFTQYKSEADTLKIAPDGLFKLLAEKLSGTLGDTVNLFQDMSKEEVQLVTNLGKINKFEPGQKIIQFGETRREIFTLLSGRVDVMHVIDGQQAVIASFESGQTFGEVAYLADTTRSADVVAKTKCDVLVHDASRLESLEKNFPVVAAKIYRNLSRIVSIRLIKTSQTTSALRAALDRIQKTPQG